MHAHVDGRVSFIAGLVFRLLEVNSGVLVCPRLSQTTVWYLCMYGGFWLHCLLCFQSFADSEFTNYMELLDQVIRMWVHTYISFFPMLVKAVSSAHSCSDACAVDFWFISARESMRERGEMDTSSFFDAWWWWQFVEHEYAHASTACSLRFQKKKRRRSHQCTVQANPTLLFMFINFVWLYVMLCIFFFF